MLAYGRCFHIACILSYSLIDNSVLPVIPLSAHAVRPMEGPRTCLPVWDTRSPPCPTREVSLEASLGGGASVGGRQMRRNEAARRPLWRSETASRPVHGSVRHGCTLAQGTAWQVESGWTERGEGERVWGRGARSLYGLSAAWFWGGAGTRTPVLGADKRMGAITCVCVHTQVSGHTRVHTTARELPPGEAA